MVRPTATSPAWSNAPLECPQMCHSLPDRCVPVGTRLPAQQSAPRSAPSCHRKRKPGDRMPQGGSGWSRSSLCDLVRLSGAWLSPPVPGCRHHQAGLSPMWNAWYGSSRAPHLGGQLQAPATSPVALPRGSATAGSWRLRPLWCQNGWPVVNMVIWYTWCWGLAWRTPLGTAHIPTARRCGSKGSQERSATAALFWMVGTAVSGRRPGLESCGREPGDHPHCTRWCCADHCAAPGVPQGRRSGHRQRARARRHAGGWRRSRRTRPAW